MLKLKNFSVLGLETHTSSGNMNTERKIRRIRNMTGNEYQNLAMRTKDSKSTNRMLGKVLNCDMIWLQHFLCRSDNLQMLVQTICGCITNKI